MQTQQDPTRLPVSTQWLKQSGKVTKVFLVILPSASTSRLKPRRRKKPRIRRNSKETPSLAHLFGVSDDGDEAQVDQNAVRGGLARCHVMPSADLPVRGPLLAQQFLRRWCAERNLNGESVASLVICDYSGKSKLGAAHVTNVATFFANLAWPKLVFPPDVTGQAGNKSKVQLAWILTTLLHGIPLCIIM